MTFNNVTDSFFPTLNNLQFLVHLSALLWSCVVRRRSSVRLSVCPSIVNFLHFRLILKNRWTEFNETWQEARSQRPLPSLCFSGRSEKQDGRPVLWLAETFSTSPLKPLNGIQRNLTGSKISTSSTKFVFFGPIGKTRWPPWPLIDWDIFDFSYETVERNSMKLDRKQDLNVLYQGPIGKTRWPPWPLIGWDIFDFFSETAERNSTKLHREQDLNFFYQVCVFRPMSKQKFLPWLICQRAGTLYSGARYVALWASCILYLIPSSVSLHIVINLLSWTDLITGITVKEKSLLTLFILLCEKMVIKIKDQKINIDSKY